MDNEKELISVIKELTSSINDLSDMVGELRESIDKNNSYLYDTEQTMSNLKSEITEEFPRLIKSLDTLSKTMSK